MKLLLPVLAILAVLSTVNAVTDETCPAGSYWANDEPIAFADILIKNVNADQPHSALGSRDGSYATLHRYGYLILDMQELVYGKEGFDLMVYGNPDDDQRIDVYVASAPTGPWTYAGRFQVRNDGEIDIGTTGFETVRYIKLLAVHTDIQIDALKGYCIEQRDVPEFSTLAALAALIGIGLFISKRR